MNELPVARCPECGRDFDPAGPSTMNFGRHVLPRVRRLFGPAYWLPNAGLIIGWGGAVVSAWWPQHPAVSWLGCCLVYLLVALVYLPRRWLRNALVLAYRQPRELRRVDNSLIHRARRRFLLPFALSLLHVPFLVSLAISYHWLHRAAYDAIFVIPAYEQPERLPVLGVFPIRHGRASVHEVRFELPLGGAIVFSVNSAGDGVTLDGKTFADDPY